MLKPIEVNNLHHRYGRKVIYDELSFSIEPGKIYGLLGKNGVGKTTLIKILMGFLRPTAGHCQVFGEDSHNLSPATRARIGLLFEGHLTYEFMTITQIERFYAPHYPRWNRNHYYDLVERLRLPHNHLIKNMSCGQRSQVVLGLIMAQQPELLILDDYSMGLDAGYRRLFLDYMREYLKNGDKTVLLTSHVIQDMERFVDEILFLKRGEDLLITSPEKFMQTFQRYRLPRNGKAQDPVVNEVIKNIETHADHWDIFSFSKATQLNETLRDQGFDPAELRPLTMNLEDAFIGYTGRY